MNVSRFIQLQEAYYRPAKAPQQPKQEEQPQSLFEYFSKAGGA